MKLVLIRGLPGSGKSTMAKTLEKVGYRHIEADQYFNGPSGRDFNYSLVRDAHAWCLGRTKTCLAEGYDTVVSNTFTQLWEMKAYVELANSPEAELIVIEATEMYKSTKDVPQSVIDNMRKRWESIK